MDEFFSGVSALEFEVRLICLRQYCYQDNGFDVIFFVRSSRLHQLNSFNMYMLLSTGIIRQSFELVAMRVIVMILESFDIIDPDSY